MQGALPVARGPALVAAAVDVGHGVGAALDVGAVQEGAAVVADLLRPVQDQVGFSRRRRKREGEREGGEKEIISVNLTFTTPRNHTVSGRRRPCWCTRAPFLFFFFFSLFPHAAFLTASAGVSLMAFSTALAPGCYRQPWHNKVQH